MIRVEKLKIRLFWSSFGQIASELFVLMSVCTKEPYVVCHPETFDDEILLFFDMEEAKKKAQELLEEKIPVSIARLENKHLLVFYTNLYAWESTRY